MPGLAWWLVKRSFVVPYPPHRLKKSAFFGRCCVAWVFGRAVWRSWRFGAVVGLVWAVRGCYPVGINTPPLCVRECEKGRVTPHLPAKKFLEMVKKGLTRGQGL